MAAINFPASPSHDDTHDVLTDLGTTTVYTFDSDKSAWFISNAGITGRTGSLTIGTVTTLDSDASATVTNVGTDTEAILDFGIPQGVKGETGQDGDVTTGKAIAMAIVFG